jgi:4-alpha-glucanotransferase
MQVWKRWHSYCQSKSIPPYIRGKGLQLWNSNEPNWEKIAGFIEWMESKQFPASRIRTGVTLMKVHLVTEGLPTHQIDSKVVKKHRTIAGVHS